MKYRQHGYQDRGEEAKKRETTERPVKKDTFGPRPIQMPGTRAVSRCSQCGSLLQSVSDPVGPCPKCGFELHSCKQCTYFEPSTRFQCLKPVPVRIAPKDQANECVLFKPRVTVARDAAGAAAPPPGSQPGGNPLHAAVPRDASNARAAFDNLFKKLEP